MVCSPAILHEPWRIGICNKIKGNDCDDTNAGINPETVWYLDADDDGYYTGSGVTTCQVFLDGYKTGGCSAAKIAMMIMPLFMHQ
jgi:hypothetical protein